MVDTRNESKLTVLIEAQVKGERRIENLRNKIRKLTDDDKFQAKERLKNLQHTQKLISLRTKEVGFAHRFRMEYLGVLFAGMALQRATTGFLRSAMTTFNSVFEETSALEQQTNRVSAAWKFFQFRLMDALSQSALFRNLVDIVVSLIDWFSRLSENVRTGIVVGFMALAVAASFLFVGGSLILGLNSINTALVEMGVLSGKGLYGFIKANPWVWAVLAGVTLIVIALSKVKGAWSDIGKIIGDVLGFVKDIITDIISGLGFSMELKGVWAGIAAGIVYVASAFGVFVKILALGLQVLITLWNTFHDLLTLNFEGISQDWKNLWENIGGMGGTSWDILKEGPIDLFERYREKLGGLTPQLQTFSETQDTLNTSISNLNIPLDQNVKNVDFLNVTIPELAASLKIESDNHAINATNIDAEANARQRNASSIIAEANARAYSPSRGGGGMTTGTWSKYQQAV